MCPDFPESAIPFRQSFMLNRPETVVPNRPEVSASDLIPVFFHFPHIRLFSFLFQRQLPFSPDPLSSGFTPASVLHPYTRIRSYFRFSPNPAPLLPALLLLPSFILIPAFALVSDFPPIPLRFFRLYSCFCPSLYPHSLLFPIFPQSRPAFSGLTPVFVLHYTRIRSY